MTIYEKLKAKRVIRQTARIQGVTPTQCRREMQEAIDAAWATADPAIMAAQLRLFPSGKPEIEEFIIRLGQEASNCRNLRV